MEHGLKYADGKLADALEEYRSGLTHDYKRWFNDID